MMENSTDVFEFKGEEQPSEIEANKFCTNYTPNGAQGTNVNSKEIGDDPSVDIDAVDGDFNGNSPHSSLDAEDCNDERMTTSPDQRRYPDTEPNNCIGGSFTGGSSNTKTAFQEIFSGSPSNDESVGTISDVDDSLSEESASYSSATPDNRDILDGQLSNHHSEHLGTFENEPIEFRPDYFNYQGTPYTDTTVTFSSSCVEVKGSSMGGSSGTLCIRFGVEDIFQIQSHLSGMFDVVVFKIHARKRETRQTEKAHETSGTEEVEFAVNDVNLSDKCEAIESLDGYKAVWNYYNEIEERRENLHGETSNQQPKKYFPSYSELLEEVIYPKGDPDAVCISKRDFDLLAPDTFVNDTVIDFYITYLKNRIPPEKRQRYHFFNCFFFRKLADMDKDPTSAFDGRAAFLRVRKWTRKVDLFDKDFVFIPVNYSYHWSLMVICHPGEVANFTEGTVESSVKVPCILHMDSLRGSHAGLKDLLQSYLWEEWAERTKETSEVVSSKFRNLRFLSLELPQQQNLTDCGLFLLHYVERFLEENPACISPYRIKNYHNEFLSINWFQPHEPSIKRSAIQRLISSLLQNVSPEHSPSCASDSCYPEDGLKISNDDDNAVELLSEHFGSSKSSDSLPRSQDNGITNFDSSSLNSVCVSDSGFALSDSFQPGSDEEPLLDMRFGHSASFNEFRSSLPPIQEEIEAGDLVYMSTETGLQHLDGSGSEACAFSYSPRCPTAEPSWFQGTSVVQAVDEKLNSSPATSVCDTENQFEVEVVEPCKVDIHMSSGEKIDHPRSAPANNIDSLAEGHTTGELLDITLAQCSVEPRDNTETVTFGKENGYDIGPIPMSDEKIDPPRSASANNIDSLAEGHTTGELDITLAQSSVEPHDNTDTGPVTFGKENGYDIGLIPESDEKMDDEKIDPPRSASANNIDSLAEGHPTGELLDITLAQSSVEPHDKTDTGPVTFGKENGYDIALIPVSDEKMDHPRSTSANNIDGLADGHATSGELLDISLGQCSVDSHDNSDSGPVTTGEENANDIRGNGDLTCKNLLVRSSDSGSEADPQHSAKRMRLTPLDEGEVAYRSSLSNDLHL